MLSGYVLLCLGDLHCSLGNSVLPTQTGSRPEAWRQPMQQEFQVWFIGNFDNFFSWAWIDLSHYFSEVLTVHRQSGTNSSISRFVKMKQVWESLTHLIAPENKPRPSREGTWWTERDYRCPVLHMYIIFCSIFPTNFTLLTKWLSPILLQSRKRVFNSWYFGWYNKEKKNEGIVKNFP